MPAPDLNVYLDHYVSRLEAGLSPIPDRVFVQPGEEVAWDQADCDGQAWVRVISVVPIVGTRRANGKVCVEWWDVTLGVGVLRCVANIDNRGNLPSPAQITRDGHAFADDMIALMTLVECDDYVRSITQAIPLGPQGGAAGSEVQFVIRLSPCCD